jgi:hypothetical protein
MTRPFLATLIRFLKLKEEVYRQAVLLSKGFTGQRIPACKHISLLEKKPPAGAPAV